VLKPTPAGSPCAIACLAFLTLAMPAAAEGLCEAYSGLPPGSGPTAGMVAIQGATFTMGDDRQRPEERAAHRVTVSPFWIDLHEVTNAQFRSFVAATGHRTIAERGLDPKDHPAMPPEFLAPGGMVFSPPTRITDREDVSQWWRYIQGASWLQPTGPGSSIAGRDSQPVVQVAIEDALAYARWAGRDLPTEAEWELAARGGLEGATYAWGDSYDPLAGWKANTWQGVFPLADEAADGFAGLAAVGCFPANAYGLYDMMGNVWEYTRDWWAPGHPLRAAVDPIGPPIQIAARFAGPTGPSVVLKGGSWLCAPDFCLRYRPAARQPQEQGLGSNHIGFRTVLRSPAG